MVGFGTTHLSGFLKGLHVRSQAREGRRIEWNLFIILEISAPDDGPYGPDYKREFLCLQKIICIFMLAYSIEI